MQPSYWLPFFLTTHSLYHTTIFSFTPLQITNLLSLTSPSVYNNFLPFTSPLTFSQFFCTPPTSFIIITRYWTHYMHLIFSVYVITKTLFSPFITTTPTSAQKRVSWQRPSLTVCHKTSDEQAWHLFTDYFEERKGKRSSSLLIPRLVDP